MLPLPLLLLLLLLSPLLSLQLSLRRPLPLMLLVLMLMLPLLCHVVTMFGGRLRGSFHVAVIVRVPLHELVAVLAWIPNETQLNTDRGAESH